MHCEIKVTMEPFFRDFKTVNVANNKITIFKLQILLSGRATHTINLHIINHSAVQGQQELVVRNVKGGFAEQSNRGKSNEVEESTKSFNVKRAANMMTGHISF